MPFRTERRFYCGFARALSISIFSTLSTFCGVTGHHLVENRAVAADHKGWGHAVNAPFDRGAAVAIDADDTERVAVAAEEAAGVVGRILVVDADDLQPLVLAEGGEQRRLVMTGHAPRRPDIDDADLAPERGR